MAKNIQDPRRLIECALCHSIVPAREVDEQGLCEVCQLMLAKVKEEKYDKSFKKS